MVRKKCPKCGFYMTDNYCIKCGYIEGNSITDIQVYSNQVDDAEVLLGNDYQQVLHNEHLFLIFLMGPLYFWYRKLFFTGTVLYILDIMIRHQISIMDISWASLGFQPEFSPVICAWITIHFAYVILANSLVLKLCRAKVKIKRKMFPKSSPKFLQIPNIILLVLIIIYFILECMLWYYVF